MNIIRRQFLKLASTLGVFGAFLGVKTKGAKADGPEDTGDNDLTAAMTEDSSRATLHIVAGAVGTGVVTYARLLAAPSHHMFVSPEGTYKSIGGALKATERAGNHPSALVIYLSHRQLNDEVDQLLEATRKFRKIIIAVTSMNQEEFGSFDKVLHLRSIRRMVEMAEFVTFTTNVKSRLLQA